MVGDQDAEQIQISARVLIPLAAVSGSVPDASRSFMQRTQNTFWAEQIEFKLECVDRVGKRKLEL